MICHDLKTLPSFYAAVISGKKRFEIRKNDRNFQVGELIRLLEWDGEDYTGEERYAQIIYLTDYEQKAGFVVLGIALLEAPLPF